MLPFTYQMLLRGELFSDYNQEEFESLAGLIMAEGKADLPFLRSVERSRVPLAKAHAALKLLHDHIPRKILEEKRGQYLTETETRVERFLKKGDLVSGLKSPQKAEHVAAYVLENRFQKGLSNNMIRDSYFPESLTTLLRQEITREHPLLIVTCVQFFTQDKRTFYS